MLRIWILTTLVLFAVTPAFAQPPAETCGAGDSLDGMDMLPFTQSGTANADDLDMSGAGCIDLGFDNVTCFTPTDPCTVQATCTDNEGREGAEGLQVVIDVFEGSCTTTPAACVASDQGTASGTVSVALTGGTTYCFVCEEMFSTSLELDLEATVGDCGSLPVELLEVDVD